MTTKNLKMDSIEISKISIETKWSKRSHQSKHIAQEINVRIEQSS